MTGNFTGEVQQTLAPLFCIPELVTSAIKFTLLLHDVQLHAFWAFFGKGEIRLYASDVFLKHDIGNEFLGLRQAVVDLFRIATDLRFTDQLGALVQVISLAEVLVQATPFLIHPTE